MKKIILSSILATSTLLNASSMCPTQEERISFGTIGAIQGAVIGGPIGVIWGLGLIYYSDNYDNINCYKVNLTTNDEIKKISTKIINTSVKPTNIPIDSTIFSSSHNSVCNFDFDKTEVKDFNGLPFNIEKVKKIKIYGHADEVGTSDYNFKLGLERAQSFHKLLEKKYSLSKIKIATGSYGETKNLDYKSDSEKRRISLEVTY
jgi:CRISPR/Cas system CMR-associated protein Cmr1 (group 7 of RAMP superfamily)